MPANCVSNSTRSALANRRHNAYVARAEEGCEYRVVRVQKNGKRPAQSDNGVSLFSLEDATRLADRWNSLNPGQTYEVERI